MKKKFMSLICGIFMMVFSLFSLTACGLVSTDTTKANKETVMIVNGVKLSKSDIYSSFYTYYQNNSNYFSYYDNKTIEDSFYTWTIIREIIDQRAQEALYDAETNPDGFIYYTKEDEKTVWKNVKNYFYSQVSAKEKAKYELEGYEEAQYPVWLRTAEEEEADTLFEAYESVKPEPVDPNRADAENLREKWSKETILSKMQELKTYLFEYVVTEEDEESGVEEVRAAIDETNYISGARNLAYAQYIESLVSSAKANGKKIDEKKLLETELVRVYEAYYESQITTIFQKCYLEEKLLESELMSNKAIVRAYLDKYLTDKQNYISESGYVSTMESSDGVPLMLYHYGDPSTGKVYYFTVQHILIKYDDNMTAELSKKEGYGASSSVDYDSEIHKAYLAERKAFTTARHSAMLTEVKDSYNLEGVTVYGSYYYYDEDLKDDPANNYGYIKVLETTVEKDGKQVKLYYVDSNDNEIYDQTIDTETYNEDQVKFMATYEDVCDTYDGAYEVWSQIAEDYYGLSDDKAKQDTRDLYKNMTYVFDTIDQMKASNKPLAEIKSKIASYLFIELQWIFSSDSLANKFSNKSGYVISNYPDENGSWVVDFAVGARALLDDMKKGVIDVDSIIASGDVKDLTKCVTSNYGYHIMKVSDIYEAGSSLVDMTDMLDEVILDDSAEGQAYVDKMIQRMQSTYVAEGSNQTVYDYFYDQLYSGYAGSSKESSSTGTYFLDLEYEWLVELYEENKISYKNKLSYSELMDYIQ